MKLTIIDKYILKRYLGTFGMMLLLFAPIGIVIDISEKIDMMLKNKVPLLEVVIYYGNFTIYFINMLFPIFLFLSVIWFTSKLANNSEIIAILGSGISFTRFLRTYSIGATLVSFFILLMSFYIVPKASDGYNNFRYIFLRTNGKELMNLDNFNIYRQISDNEFIYVNNYNLESKIAFNFALEKFEGEKLVSKITTTRIKWNEKTKDYTLFDYVKRTIGAQGDSIEKANEKTMKINFTLDDLSPVIYKAETLSLTKLNDFIDKERKKGSSSINIYLVVLYKKYSVPVSAFILTIIAVAVSAMKRRGGMGINLAIGIAIAFSFVFFDKIFGVLAEKSAIPPFFAVWLPNFGFGILAIFLLIKAKR
jgi:lipopolysaccharide export system permease protein